MFKPFLTLSALVWISLVPLSGSRPASGRALSPGLGLQEPAKIPSETKNPAKSTPDSRAKAKKMYGYDCEMCHAASGDGKTDLAKDMGITLTDLSDPKTLASKTDADLFNLFRNGKDKMPAEDSARAKPDDIWNLVIYVRSLAKN